VNTEETIAALDAGEVRVAEPDGDGWRVNSDVQAAILDYFRLRQMEPREVGPFEYHDKIPLKSGYEALGVRVVPPATARYGAFLSRGVVLMPSYVNIGAWVGPPSAPARRSARMSISQAVSASAVCSSRRARAP
jgi:2,3,4,5-tetrahydropyridine-2-carboxylate N-succinyltransferase